MKVFHVIFMLFFACFLFGCQSLAQNKNSQTKETAKDVETAVGAVVNTVRGQKRIVKFCPVCGKHYGGSLKKCTVDGTVLQTVKE